MYDVLLLARECKIYISNVMTSKESSKSASFDDVNDDEEEEEERARTNKR